MRWPVWTSYELELGKGGAWIHPAGELAREYDPSEHDVAASFARIPLAGLYARGPGRGRRKPRTGELDADPKVRAVLAFMRQYGHLGQCELAGEYRRVGGRLVTGDRLTWVTNHARNVYDVLSVRSRLERSRWGELRALLEELDSPLTRVPTLSGSMKPGLEGLRGTGAAAGRRWLAALLNPNLQRVRREVDPETGSSRFTRATLIEEIYWQVAERLDHVRRCECGAFFFFTDPRQKHCPPPEGQRESLCTKRFRMRSLRSSKKK